MEVTEDIDRTEGHESYNSCRLKDEILGTVGVGNQIFSFDMFTIHIIGVCRRIDLPKASFKPVFGRRKLNWKSVNLYNHCFELTRCIRKYIHGIFVIIKSQRKETLEEA